MRLLLSYLFHFDVYLSSFIQHYGLWAYGLLFLILFCETGLVFTPFLPGDSLLFTAGALAAAHTLNILWLFPICCLAVVLGDSVNYEIGRTIGEKLLTRPGLSRWIRPAHVERTKHFYAKHGNKMIVLARFVPIVRTLAPFVAGIGGMSYPKFLTYNILGGVFWVSLFTFGGYFFGTLPVIRDHFSLVIFGMIGVSLIPALVEFVQQHRAASLGE